MTARHTTIASQTWTINDLNRGSIYRATTSEGTAIGEFLGLETPHGDRAILLRNNAGTTSIDVDDVTAIFAIAA